MEKQKRKHVTEMYEAILKIQNLEECEQFFEDLCIPFTIKSIGKR